MSNVTDVGPVKPTGKRAELVVSPEEHAGLERLSKSSNRAEADRARTILKLAGGADSRQSPTPWACIRRRYGVSSDAFWRSAFRVCPRDGIRGVRRAGVRRFLTGWPGTSRVAGLRAGKRAS